MATNINAVQGELNRATWFVGRSVPAVQPLQVPVHLPAPLPLVQRQLDNAVWESLVRTTNVQPLALAALALAVG